MTKPELDTQSDAAYVALRMEAHAELFDKLSKLRTFLGMLNHGAEHFYRLDDAQRAEYLGTCADYANAAFKALTVWDGVEAQA